MIFIEIGSSTINKIGKSLFLFLDKRYEVEQLDRLKDLPTLVEHRESKCFETKIAYFDNVLILLEDWDITFDGELTEKQLTKIATINNIRSTPDDAFTFKTEPMQHQLDSFEYAKNVDSFLLADDQGLGKTKQAIDIAVSRKQSMKHCLVVCGVSGLRWNWEKEIETHSWESGHIVGSRVNNKGKVVVDGLAKRIDDLKTPRDDFFLIINVESLRNKELLAILVDMCNTGEIGMTIIDEIHKCKNTRNQQGKSMLSLNSYYKLGMTGTPLLNSPIDLYGVLKWLGYEHGTVTSFENYFCEKKFDEIVGYKHLDELHDLIQSAMLRRLKEDVLDLPDKTVTKIYVDMNTKQSKIYNEVLTQVKKDIDKVRLYKNPLAETIRLRQATGYPEILTTVKIESPKFIKAIELIDNAVSVGSKAIVMSNWTKVINPFYELVSNYYDTTIVTGEVVDKFESIERFQNDSKTKVIVGTIGALGTGYTLTAGDTVIFLDIPWTAGDKLQAEDRAHRIGALSNVFIFDLICKGTIDERIDEIVTGKAMLSNSLIESDGKVIGDVTKMLDFMLS